mmetsp:Transcript_20577/g.33895  ORF Transcript_20577/g.33895 Transcript_20577/m.33895 type:complete len:2225 (-) Transcript_20577:175-6849(-)|eukprot:CAMPEP_0184655224 /NCGR_PEP_ID=MMETSP0308-20130426/12846_1 /TAXON_ID=38269 /ORGANISM="Gloeochaete witrockiana, Strain SAG 46.84" /LENGTH=2224 /DNA_ID=CAMNT_0027091573 /DNA_START=61 /DNA_END=6735 /DNA_ORIENTATION=+
MPSPPKQRPRLWEPPQYNAEEMFRSGPGEILLREAYQNKPSLIGKWNAWATSSGISVDTIGMHPLLDSMDRRGRVSTESLAIVSGILPYTGRAPHDPMLSLLNHLVRQIPDRELADDTTPREHVKLKNRSTIAALRIQQWWRHVRPSGTFIFFKSATQVLGRHKHGPFFYRWKKYAHLQKRGRLNRVRAAFDEWKDFVRDCSRFYKISASLINRMMLTQGLNPIAVWRVCEQDKISFPFSSVACAVLGSMLPKKLCVRRLRKSFTMLQKWRQFRMSRRHAATLILNKLVLGLDYVRDNFRAILHMWHRFVAFKHALRNDEEPPTYPETIVPQWNDWLNRYWRRKEVENNLREQGIMLTSKRRFAQWWNYVKNKKRKRSRYIRARKLYTEATVGRCFEGLRIAKAFDQAVRFRVRYYMRVWRKIVADQIRSRVVIARIRYQIEISMYKYVFHQWRDTVDGSRITSAHGLERLLGNANLLQLHGAAFRNDLGHFCFYECWQKWSRRAKRKVAWRKFVSWHASVQNNLWLRFLFKMLQRKHKQRLRGISPTMIDMPALEKAYKDIHERPKAEEAHDAGQQERTPTSNPSAELTDVLMLWRKIVLLLRKHYRMEGRSALIRSKLTQAEIMEQRFVAAARALAEKQLLADEDKLREHIRKLHGQMEAAHQLMTRNLTRDAKLALNAVVEDSVYKLHQVVPRFTINVRDTLAVRAAIDAANLENSDSEDDCILVKREEAANSPEVELEGSSPATSLPPTDTVNADDQKQLCARLKRWCNRTSRKMLAWKTHGAFDARTDDEDSEGGEESADEEDKGDDDEANVEANEGAGEASTGREEHVKKTYVRGPDGEVDIFELMDGPLGKALARFAEDELKQCPVSPRGPAPKPTEQSYLAALAETIKELGQSCKGNPLQSVRRRTGNASAVSVRRRSGAPESSNMNKSSRRASDLFETLKVESRRPSLLEKPFGRVKAIIAPPSDSMSRRLSILQLALGSTDIDTVPVPGSDSLKLLLGSPEGPSPDFKSHALLDLFDRHDDPMPSNRSPSPSSSCADYLAMSPSPQLSSRITVNGPDHKTASSHLEAVSGQLLSEVGNGSAREGSMRPPIAVHQPNAEQQLSHQSTTDPANLGAAHPQDMSSMRRISIVVGDVHPPPNSKESKSGALVNGEVAQVLALQTVTETESSEQYISGPQDAMPEPGPGPGSVDWPSSDESNHVHDQAYDKTLNRNPLLTNKEHSLRRPQGGPNVMETTVRATRNSSSPLAPNKDPSSSKAPTKTPTSQLLSSLEEAPSRAEVSSQRQHLSPPPPRPQSRLPQSNNTVSQASLQRPQTASMRGQRRDRQSMMQSDQKEEANVTTNPLGSLVRSIPITISPSARQTPESFPSVGDRTSHGRVALIPRSKSPVYMGPLPKPAALSEGDESISAPEAGGVLMKSSWKATNALSHISGPVNEAAYAPEDVMLGSHNAFHPAQTHLLDSAVEAEALNNTLLNPAPAKPLHSHPAPEPTGWAFGDGMWQVLSLPSLQALNNQPRPSMPIPNRKPPPPPTTLLPVNWSTFLADASSPSQEPLPPSEDEYALPHVCMQSSASAPTLPTSYTFPAAAASSYQHQHGPPPPHHSHSLALAKQQSLPVVGNTSLQESPPPIVTREARPLDQVLEEDWWKSADFQIALHGTLQPHPRSAPPHMPYHHTSASDDFSLPARPSSVPLKHIHSFRADSAWETASVVSHVVETSFPQSISTSTEKPSKRMCERQNSASTRIGDHHHFEQREDMKRLRRLGQEIDEIARRNYQLGQQTSALQARLLTKPSRGLTRSPPRSLSSSFLLSAPRPVSATVSVVEGIVKSYTTRTSSPPLPPPPPPRIPSPPSMTNPIPAEAEHQVSLHSARDDLSHPSSWCSTCSDTDSDEHQVPVPAPAPAPTPPLKMHPGHPAAVVRRLHPGPQPRPLRSISRPHTAPTKSSLTAVDPPPPPIPRDPDRGNKDPTRGNKDQQSPRLEPWTATASASSKPSQPIPESLHTSTSHQQRRRLKSAPGPLRTTISHPTEPPDSIHSEGHTLHAAPPLSVIISQDNQSEAFHASRKHSRSKGMGYSTLLAGLTRKDQADMDTQQNLEIEGETLVVPAAPESGVLAPLAPNQFLAMFANDYSSVPLSTHSSSNTTLDSVPHNQPDKQDLQFASWCVARTAPRPANSIVMLPPRGSPNRPPPKSMPKRDAGGSITQHTSVKEPLLSVQQIRDRV